MILKAKTIYLKLEGFIHNVISVFHCQIQGIEVLLCKAAALCDFQIEYWTAQGGSCIVFSSVSIF